MANADIDARATDPDYISVLMLVEGANNEYAMIVSSNCWGPSGKLDNGNAPESLFTKAQVNSLVQCQVSVVLSTHHGGNSGNKIDPPGTAEKHNKSQRNN